MPVSRQQAESLEYFRQHAAEWRTKADGADSAAVNVIEQRNDFVLAVAAERRKTSTVLDVGCGTGELVCEMARRGYDATGVDFSPEMVGLGEKLASDENLGNARFVCASALEFEMPRDGYDLVSANGLVEYLSYDEMCDLFGRISEALAPGGSFVVGSRNRLFNLMSMNDFTLQELASGETDSLTREAVAWVTGGLEAVQELEGQAGLQLAGIAHAHTGIDVGTRFQYTPLQLITLLRRFGLRALEVYPVHVHGATPAFGSAHPDVHTAVANLLQMHARHETRLLPNASTFMLHVAKAE